MNPNDVFPRRNLPGDADVWGREVEERIRATEYAAVTQKQAISGTNRTSASSLQELSRQLTRLQALYRSIPRPVQATATTTGTGLVPGWSTIATVNITVPEGVNQGTVLATGSGLLVSNTDTTSTAVGSYSRILISGVAGPQSHNPYYQSFGAYRSMVVPSASRSFPVTPGTVITVELQAYPDDAAYYPPNGGTYATLSVIGTFTG